MSFNITKQRSDVFSSFELWPSFVFYAPLFCYWLTLACKYKSLTLPTIVNPRIPTGGLCGESKSAILSQAGSKARKVIAPFVLFRNSKHAYSHALSFIKKHSLHFPLVLKPDVGCRGSGVRRVNNSIELKEYLSDYPKNTHLILQELIDMPLEVGIFYMRHPKESFGTITSITYKMEPTLIGDGSSTIIELLEADPRMKKLEHLYLKRIKDKENIVLRNGEKYSLVFSGNHCRGSIFKNGSYFKTPGLEANLNEILRDIPEFHYGRIDLKANSKDDLMSGKNFKIIEINGIGSEPTHIWDKDAKLISSYKSYFEHWEKMFEFGSEMRERGWKPMKTRELFKVWRAQKKLICQYPDNN